MLVAVESSGERDGILACVCNRIFALPISSRAEYFLLVFAVDKAAGFHASHKLIERRAGLVDAEAGQ